MDRREFIKTLAILPFTISAGKQSESGYLEPHKALYWEGREDGSIQCKNCPHGCVLREGERGFCRVRENRGGQLYTMVYGNPCAVHLDPIEKKPLYHFLPGTISFSIATAGCNMRCKYCQNYTISQMKPEYTRNYELSPEKLLENVNYYRLKHNVQSIAYTYTEPTVFIEYMLDSARLVNKEGIRNIYHSNGYIQKSPLLDLIEYLSGANVDLKFFRNNSYNKISKGKLEPVLNSLILLKKGGVWLEITYLIVPTINDSKEELTDMINWIIENLGVDVPIHFSRFFPTYKLENLPRTPLKTVERARQLAIEMGVHYSYVGNVPVDHPGSNTYCPSCGKLLIKRRGFSIVENRIKNNSCFDCGEKIAGIWQ